MKKTFWNRKIANIFFFTRMISYLEETEENNYSKCCYGCLEGDYICYDGLENNNIKKIVDGMYNYKCHILMAIIIDVILINILILIIILLSPVLLLLFILYIIIVFPIHCCFIILQNNRELYEEKEKMLNIKKNNNGI